MQKILFLGKLDQTMEILYKNMCREYQIQFCTEISKTMQNMIRIVKPDMLLLNISEKNELTKKDFEILTTMYMHIPLLCLADKELFYEYEEFIKNENVYCVHRPVLADNVKAKCDVILKKCENTNPEDEEEAVQRKSILVVDDGAITLRSVKALLDSRYEVSVATSGEKALKRMEKSLPDLVLLDYEMPGLNGKETLERIRADENMKDVPVIFLTGVADKQYIADVLQLNPMGYILKPPDKEKLFETIENALNFKEE